MQPECCHDAYRQYGCRQEDYPEDTRPPVLNRILSEFHGEHRNLADQKQGKDDRQCGDKPAAMAQ